MILITGEPEQIYHYSKSFIDKFDKILTSRVDIPLEKRIISPPAQPWWIGRGSGDMKRFGEENFEPIQKLEKNIVDMAVI